MFPPWVDEVAVEIACRRGGATPKQPSMGSSGSVSLPSLVFGATSVAFHLFRSIRQLDPLHFGDCMAVRGSSTCGAITVELHPTSRLGASRSKVTDNMSPGSAPSMWNGPVCGFPHSVTRLPEASAPALSTVVVITVSPGLIRRTGSCAPIVV